MQALLAAALRRAGARPPRAPRVRRRAGSGRARTAYRRRPRSPTFRGGNQRVLDASLVEMVEHLVARERNAAQIRRRFDHLDGVEVAHACESALTLLDQCLERLHRRFERMFAGPVQEIEIHVLAPESLQRCAARPTTFHVGGVARQDFRRNEEPFARKPADRFADQLLDVVRRRTSPPCPGGPSPTRCRARIARCASSRAVPLSGMFHVP